MCDHSFQFFCWFYSWCGCSMLLLLLCCEIKRSPVWLFTCHSRHIFLWIALFRFAETVVTPVGNQSKVLLFALYIIQVNWNIFYNSNLHVYTHAQGCSSQQQKRRNICDGNLTWQFNWWRADQWHQRHVSRLCHLALSQTTTPIFFLTFFPTVEPGLRLTLFYKRDLESSLQQVIMITQLYM